MVKMIEQDIRLTLPLPPTLSSAYTNGANGGRFKTQKYKDWQEECGILLLGQQYTIKGDKWLYAEYTLYMPIWCKNGKKRVVDTYNREKTLSDTLAILIEGFEDHKILDTRMKKIQSERNEVEVVIRETEE